MFSRIARTLIADDLAAARSAWPAIEKLDTVDSVSVVTRQGDVLTRSVLRGGSGAGRSRLELPAERDAASVALTDVATAIERARTTVEAPAKLDWSARIELARKWAVMPGAESADSDVTNACERKLQI